MQRVATRRKFFFISKIRLKKAVFFVLVDNLFKNLQKHLTKTNEGCMIISESNITKRTKAQGSSVSYRTPRKKTEDMLGCPSYTKNGLPIVQGSTLNSKKRWTISHGSDNFSNGWKIKTIMVSRNIRGICRYGRKHNSLCRTRVLPQGSIF